MATYALTRSQAREAVFVYCDQDCLYYAKQGEKPQLPYRATFRRALAGDFGALHTVFTDRNYHSGDNEDWIDVHWAILHAVGDQPFASFLTRLTPQERDTALMYLRYSIMVPDQEFWPYFEQHFPLVTPIYRRYLAQRHA